MEDFFRYYLAAITGEYSPKHILYQAFKDYWYETREIETTTELLEKLVRYSNYFSNLYYKEPSGKYSKLYLTFNV